MSDQTKDEIIKGHEYDGILELDNPLPKWWLFIFYTTIIFAIGYWSYYQFLGGPTLQQELAAELESIQAMKATHSKPKSSGGGQNLDIEALLANNNVLTNGKAAYEQTCAACHGQNGEGIIGPNLTDKYWLHSKGDYPGILAALEEGFPEKGMPAWKDIIPQESHTPIVIYVMSLAGTQPANPKEPQGELIE